MTKNTFFQLNFNVPEDHFDEIEAHLFEVGALSIEMNPETVTQWRVLFSDKPHLPESLLNFATESGHFLDSTWQTKWLDHYDGVRFSDVLEIRPWLDSELPPRQKGEAICIWLDPRDAFGDGRHATSRQCIGVLEKHLLSFSPEARAHLTMVDVGTGTGLLAIAAHKRGVETVHAFDLEEDSVQKSKKNAALNECESIDIWQQDLYQWKPEKRYDIVSANLLTQILVDNMSVLLRATAPNGIFILSGMSTPHIPIIQRLLTELKCEFTVTEEDGWGCFCGVMPPAQAL